MSDFMSRRKAEMPAGHVFPGEQAHVDPSEAHADIMAAIRKWGGTEYADTLEQQARELYEQILPEHGLDFEPADTLAMEREAYEYIIRATLEDVAQHALLLRTLKLQDRTLFRRLDQ